jgi:galactokinase
MTADQDTAVLGATGAKSSAPHTPAQPPDWTASKLVARVLETLPAGRPRFVARAPGRLDVMGGSAEYFGALVLNMTTTEHACVAVQQANDPKLSIRVIRPGAADSTLVVDLGRINQALDKPIESAADGDGRDGLGDCPTSRCVVGTAVEMLRAGLLPRSAHGLRISVGSMISEAQDIGPAAAVAAATLAAVAKAANSQVEPGVAVGICQRVENTWLGVPVGPADSVCALVGEPHTLTQLHCCPCDIGKLLRLPENLAILGVDCGRPAPASLEKYTRVRIATAMGRALIERIVRFEGYDSQKSDGNRSPVSVSDYVKHFRDRLPTKLKGREFLDRFGETGDPLTRIEPDVVYKIRSRSEHHIYENDRARGFAKLLSHSLSTGDQRSLVEAGELMYASHWSYGQRCGLGSIETDLLVSLIRKRAKDAEIYGAKVSGRGCGGIVTVSMRATDTARAALDAAIQDYESKSGQAARLIQSSSPGALVAGVQRM